MFGRKKKRPFHLQLWSYVPSRSLKKWGRGIAYHWHRLNRIKGSTRSIALGFAFGASISMTPFIGVHLLMGAILTLLCRGSMAAMLIALTLFGNPWMIPLIFWIDYSVGRLFIDRPLPDFSDGTGLISDLHLTIKHFLEFMFGKISISEFASHLYELYLTLLPYIIGSIPVTLFMFFFCFYAVEEAIIIYNTNRHKKRNLKRKEGNAP